MTALRDFRATLRQSENLIAREGRFNDPPATTASRTAVLALRGGATVLMVATFERFLRDLFTQEISKLATNPPPVGFSTLPQPLRVASVFGSLEFAMKGRLPPGVTGKAARLPAIQRAAQLVVDGLVDAAALSETGGNPGAANVKELFKAAGVPSVFQKVRPAFDAQWHKPEAANFLADKLDEIVNSRHRVAHLADALSVSRAQLAEWPTFLSALAGVLSDELERHVDSLLPP